METANKLVLNDVEDYEPIYRFKSNKTPIAYNNKVKCLMLSGINEEDAKRIALEPIELELYYEVGYGLMAVESAAVESETIYSPYSGEMYSNKNKIG